MFIFQQQLSFITSTYNIVQSQNSVQESRVRPWQCAIRKSVFTTTGFPQSLGRSLGKDIGIRWHGTSRSVRTQQLAHPSTSSQWRVLLWRTRRTGSLTVWSWFYKVGSERQITVCTACGEEEKKKEKTVLTGNTAIEGREGWMSWKMSGGAFW